MKQDLHGEKPNENQNWHKQKKTEIKEKQSWHVDN